MMKPIHLLALSATIIALISFTACETLDDALSDADVIAGLKEALTVGTDTSVSKASTQDGYFAHAVNKILMPDEAQPVINTVSSLPGGDALIDELVLKMNRAAESAAGQATPIFVDAITGMTIEDGWGILNGHNTAATEYLETNTRTGLYGVFKPTVEGALTDVGAQQAWDEVFSLYNSVPFVDPVNADLADHTTNRGLDGLFNNVADEETKIREDPAHRVTQLLEDVFAEQD